MNNEESPKREIIEVLREGRAKPDYILQVTSINDQSTLDYHIRGLRVEGRVEYVHPDVDGFYRLTDEEHERLLDEELADADDRELDPLYKAAFRAAARDNPELDADEFEFPAEGSGDE